LVTFALLTLPPLALRPVRLACLIHAANVHSEPGSNPSRLEQTPRKEPIQPSSLRILANTNWSPRNRDPEEINPRPRDSRQHEPSDSVKPRHLATPRLQKTSNRIHAGFPQGIAQKTACLQTIDRIVKEERRGINSTLRRDRPERPALKRAKPRPNGSGSTVDDKTTRKGRHAPPCSQDRVCWRVIRCISQRRHHQRQGS
jgi:hypothetical protein